MINETSLLEITFWNQGLCYTCRGVQQHWHLSAKQSVLGKHLGIYIGFAIWPTCGEHYCPKGCEQLAWLLVGLCACRCLKWFSAFSLLVFSFWLFCKLPLLALDSSCCCKGCSWQKCVEYSFSISLNPSCTEGGTSEPIVGWMANGDSHGGDGWRSVTLGMRRMTT